MAAVLCSSIGDLCNAIRTCIDKAICAPCGEACHGIGRLCEGMRTCIDEVVCTSCKKACKGIVKSISSPFFFYIVVVLGFNVPQIAFARELFGNRSFVNNGGDENCGGVRHWVMVNAAFCAVNVVAALYISKVIGGRRDGGRFDANETSPLKRVKDVLCYDPVVAAYIVVGMAYLIWHLVGVKRFLTNDCDDRDTNGALLKSLECNWCFIFLGGVAFTCSICCASARSKHSYQPIGATTQGAVGGPTVY